MTELIVFICKKGMKFGIYSSLLCAIVLSSCVSSKRVPYFQSNEKGIVDIPSFRLESTIRFKPDDVLSITVNVPDEPAVAADYNLSLVPEANTENSGEIITGGAGRQTYLVKKDGTIDFPVIGTIYVVGYTQDEFESYLKERLKSHIKAPTVITVRMVNFNILVTGEVNSPGFVTSKKDHLNILEALALAGDMTIYGKRDKILLLRETLNGGYRKHYLDINREDLISSPYFFLQQNDAIVVSPVKAKTQSADISPMLSVAMGITTFSMSLVTFILMITR